MTHQFSLAYLTVMDQSPPEAVQVAADCGYAFIGFRLLPSAGNDRLPLMHDARIVRETRAAMQDTGVRLADIEIVRIGEQFDARSFEPFLQRGAELGAANILVAGDDPQRQRLIESFGRFCELAAGYAMTADLEFMPWTRVPAISDASEIVLACGQPNAGVLIDALHFARSDSSLEQVAALPRHVLNYAQICDAPGDYDDSVDGLIFTAREERLEPGDGDIDLRGLLRALPDDLLLSLEIPSLSRARSQSARERAGRAIAKARALLT